jgi:hypothetical protein
VLLLLLLLLLLAAKHNISRPRAFRDLFQWVK